MEEEKKKLLDFSMQWDKAMIRNDVEKIGPFMSEDWALVGNDGITTKKTFLEWIQSGSVTHSRMDSDKVEIKIIGNTGILISRGTSAGNHNGEKFNLYEWSSNVFIKTNGEWLCVLTMLTTAK